jgi:hypothetical protein
VAANDPRIEFRPSREARKRLEELRRELSKQVGKPVSVSKLLGVIVAQFFEYADRSRR